MLYRATRDGFGAVDFHRQCDFKMKTLTIIKSKNGSIFGGYLDKAWDSIDAWRCDCNAFLYSLINKNNKPFKAMISSRDGFNAIQLVQK